MKQKTQIQLSDHFTYRKLLKFTIPSICMMVFTSIYGVVDGFFVSNFVGKTPFAAVNFIMPFIMALSALGFMFGTGGSALVAKTLGEQKKDKANDFFSLIVVSIFVCGTIIAVLGSIFLRKISMALGADGEMLDNCVKYGRVILLIIPFFMLQLGFQSFFVTAGKPQLGLACTLISGFANMALDALLVAVFSLGLIGAAAATAISQLIGGIIPLIYFIRPNSSSLRLKIPKFDGRALLKTCLNGSSEFLSNVSMSLVGMLYNVQLIKYAGENGVASYGVLMYISFFFNSIFIGYSIGTASVVGYHYGAGNQNELRGLRKKSMRIIILCSLCMLTLSQTLAAPLSEIFVGYDPDLLALTKRGFVIYSFSFLFAGIAIFASSFFTALNDGLTSALISFLRTLVFQIAAVIIFPLIWGVDGIWLSVVVAELLAVLVSIILLAHKQKKYKY